MNVSELRVIFRVRDFRKSVHFYEDLLGMERLKSWDRPGEEPGIILRAGDGRTFELFGPPSGGEQDDRIASGVEITMQVDAVDAWHDQLKAAGVPIARGRVDNPWGDRSFGVDDPDGVRLWFFQVIDLGT
jgi:catechol 2,3-dioxygenase-like lactoylglutathione lyase family enzyme